MKEFSLALLLLLTLLNYVYAKGGFTYHCHHWTSTTEISFEEFLERKKAETLCVDSNKFSAHQLERINQIKNIKLIVIYPGSSLSTIQLERIATLVSPQKHITVNLHDTSIDYLENLASANLTANLIITKKSVVAKHFRFISGLKDLAWAGIQIHIDTTVEDNHGFSLEDLQEIDDYPRSIIYPKL